VNLKNTYHLPPLPPVTSPSTEVLQLPPIVSITILKNGSRHFTTKSSFGPLKVFKGHHIFSS